MTLLPPLPPLPGVAQQPLPFPVSGVNSFPQIATECVASGQPCSYGPYGQSGEMQCRFCANPLPRGADYLPQMPALPPLPRANLEEVRALITPALPTIGEQREAAMLAAVVPAVPTRRVYSQGRRVTDWYPMRVLPCADRKGEYEVQFDNAPESLEYWDGKRWPTLAGNFHAIGWRGVADAPATA